ncbi:MAG TPA: hypothetical protein VGN01_01790 [Acidobacteriaceae bacterium]
MRRPWRDAAAAVVSLVLCLPAGAAVTRDSDGPVRIPLAPMGYQTLSSEFLLAGSSMLTVHFVDKDHLLITFGLRHLMKREPGDPPDDEDRTVGAFLVEAASGKVLARTEWRLHDRSQYLWSLGHGRFLLRVRDRLTTFAPMASDNGNDAFREIPLLRVDRHIVAMLISSDSDLLTVESTKFSMGAGAANEGFSADPAPVQINFYRLREEGPTLDGLKVSNAGVVRSRTAVALPMTSAGILDVLDAGKDRWLFNFNEYAGKVHELAEWDTSCFPRPTFVGPTEFVAFGCRGSQDRLELAGFNMKGEEMWQQNFLDSHVGPTFAFAPAAGRFALGRTIVSTPLEPDVPLAAGTVVAQEVRVYQSYDGKILFKIECTPVERAGQNFAMSDDGMRLAVVRETQVRHSATKDYDAYMETQAAVEVYSLPELTKEDTAALKAAEKLAPEDSGVRIDLALMKSSGGSGSAQNGAAAAPPEPLDVPAPAPPVEAGTPSPAVAGTQPAGDAADAGNATTDDSAPAESRKAPTLYSPDEKQPKKGPQ